MVKQKSTSAQAQEEHDKKMEQITLIGVKPVLNTEEAALFCSMTVGTLHRLTSQRLVPHYKRGKLVFFDKTELESWLKETKVPTQQQTESEAAKYCMQHKSKF